MIGELSDDAIDMVLATHHIGHIGCIDQGRPYVVPVTYVYEDGCVYGHTNRGKKVAAMRENPQVCFQVDDIQDMRHWRSVVAYGKFEELSGEAAAKGLDLLFVRLPGARSESSVPDDETLDDRAQQIKLRATKGVVYRIRIEDKSGRFERP